MKKETFRYIGISLFIVTVVYCFAPRVLEGYHYRIAFRLSAAMLLLTLWVAFGIYGIARFAARATRESTCIISMVLVWIGATAAVIVLGFCYWFGYIAWAFTADITEKEYFDNGTMLISISDSPNGKWHHERYVMRTGLVFYRELTAGEEAALGITQPKAPARAVPIVTRQSESETAKTLPPAEAETDFMERCGEITAIYQSLAVADEVSIEEDLPLSFYLDAKGRLYAIVRQDETNQYRLVYDRRSRNGECDLFVYYALPLDDLSVAGESMINTFAVNTETKEVVPSGKTNWSDGGSQEYYEFSGEW